MKYSEILLATGMISEDDLRGFSSYDIPSYLHSSSLDYINFLREVGRTKFYPLWNETFFDSIEDLIGIQEVPNDVNPPFDYSNIFVLSQHHGYVFDYIRIGDDEVYRYIEGEEEPIFKGINFYEYFNVEIRLMMESINNSTNKEI